MSIEKLKDALSLLACPVQADLVAGHTQAAKRELLNAIQIIQDYIEEAEKQKPVAWSVLNKQTGKHWYTNESEYTSRHYANEYSHQEPDGSLSMVVKPLYTHPGKAIGK